MSRRVRLVALVILALFVAFEVGIRLVQPNGMTFAEYDSSGRALTMLRYDQPQMVGGWYTYVNNERSLGFAAPCSFPLTYSPETFVFTFTWYGIPVETLSGQNANICAQYKRSAGGIPDLFNTYFLTNPNARSTPPPVGHQQVP